MRYAALLRGINVGGRRRLKMHDLREIVVEAGGEDVVTYIQSGNVVLSHASRSGARVEAALEAAIEDATGMAVPVVARSAREWSAVIEGNPFPDAGPTQLHVVFLKGPIAPDALDGLALDRFAPEEVVVAGRELYLHLPEGMGRASLPTELERRGPSRATGTTRNWATVVRLGEMLRR